jgi:hypothetical protein
MRLGLTRTRAGAVIGGVLLVACGKVTDTGGLSNIDEPGSHPDATSVGTSDAGSPAQALSGVVLAAINQTVAVEDPGRNSLAVAFSSRLPFDFDYCDTPRVGDCCCSSGAQQMQPLPLPTAATVTVASTAGQTLATLSSPEAYTGKAWNALDLGRWGIVVPSEYSADVLGGWDLGETLHIEAAGAVVHSLSGDVPAGALLTGISPSFDSQVAIDRSKDFRVTWDPDATLPELQKTVLLTIGAGIGPACYCTTPDASGEMTATPSALSRFVPTASTTYLILARLVMVPATCDNARVTLATSVEHWNSATFQ